MTANNPHEIAMRTEAENRRLEAINADLLAALKNAEPALHQLATEEKRATAALGPHRSTVAVRRWEKARAAIKAAQQQS